MQEYSKIKKNLRNLHRRKNKIIFQQPIPEKWRSITCLTIQNTCFKEGQQATRELGQLRKVRETVHMSKMRSWRKKCFSTSSSLWSSNESIETSRSGKLLLAPILNLEASVWTAVSMIERVIQQSTFKLLSWVVSFEGVCHQGIMVTPQGVTTSLISCSFWLTEVFSWIWSNKFPI